MSYLHRQFKIFLIVASGAAFGCTEEDVSSRQLNNSGKGGLLQQIRDGVIGFENEQGWPAPPRDGAEYVWEHTESDTFKINMTTETIPVISGVLQTGVKVDILKATKIRITAYAVSTSNENYNPKRSTPEINPNGYVNDVFVTKALDFDDGTGVNEISVANTWDGKRKIVFFCHYSGSFEDSKTGMGQFTLLKNGATKEVNIVERVTVFKMSKFATVAPGESLNSLKKRCMDLYYNEGFDIELHRRLQNSLTDVFIHSPKSKCITDEECKDYAKPGRGLGLDIVGRCVNVLPETLQCRNFGRENVPCPVYQNYKNSKGVEKRIMISRPEFSFPCDRGLSCVITRKGYPLSEGLSNFLSAGHRDMIMLKPAVGICKKTDEHPLSTNNISIPWNTPSSGGISEQHAWPPINTLLTP